MIPECAETEEILRRIAGKNLLRMFKEATLNAEAQVLTQQEINQLIHECVSLKFFTPHEATHG